ncbi:MAG: TlyA family RNA methyltransferase [Lachnospiraceae bacterium]|nr:TlyA family RNA methyltransferase [Lachnospiraceae bacterium]
MERLDALLVKNGSAPSRERAKEMIKAGRVFVNGKVITKASFTVGETDDIKTEGEGLKYVSRGGLKLEKAITEFNICLEGLTCMDIGASTGGFTDCMLQNGAAKVLAVDVGTDQLVEKLKNDPRVISMEQTNIRYLTPHDIGNIGIDFISADVSFISLTKVLPVIFTLLKEGGESICLIKPQFEAGRQALSKKGIIKDKAVRDKAVADVSRFAEDTGFKVLGITASPIEGGDGNVEFLIFLKKGN